MEGWCGRIFNGCGFFDPDKPIRKFTTKSRAIAVQEAEELAAVQLAAVEAGSESTE